MNRNGKMKQLKKKEYEIIPRSLLQHERLSLQAIGLLGNLLSYPDDWELFKSELYHRFPKNKETSVRNAFNELIEEKYIVEVKERDGKKWKYYYYFAKEPFTEDEIIEIFEDHGMEPPSNKEKEDKSLGTGKSSSQENEKNLGTRFSRPQNEDSKMETSKPRSNILHTKQNTQRQNTQKNITHLSIKQNIEELEISSYMKDWLLSNTKRLIDRQIDIHKIVDVYNMKTVIDDGTFISVLDRVIDSFKTNFKECLKTSLLREQEKLFSRLKQDKSIHKGALPKWLENQDGEDSEGQNTISEEEFLTKKKALEELIKRRQEEKNSDGSEF